MGTQQKIQSKSYKNKIVKIILLILSLIGLCYTANFYYDYYFGNSSFLNRLVKSVNGVISSTSDKISEKTGNKKYLVIEYHVPVRYAGDSPIRKIERELSENAKIVSPEKINNVGYTFNLGQLDYSDDNSLLTDTLKNNFTNIIYGCKFPKSLLNNLSFVIVNTLAVVPETYIETSEGLVKIEDFDPRFLQGGGIYSQIIADQSFVFIHKDFVEDNNKLKEVLTHELGHHVGAQLTDSEWSEFYEFRNIPKSTPRYNSNWVTSPVEDFAEVYKNIFTGLPIKTSYGLLTSNEKVWDGTETDWGPCGEIFIKLTMLNGLSSEQALYNTGLQECRRNNASSYSSFVTNETKNFINKIITRLN